MISFKVKIAKVERQFNESIDEQWIIQQINRRRAEGQSPCVRVTIDGADLNMILSTPNCPKNNLSTRPARPHEKEIIEIWNKHGLNDENFTGNNMITFFQQLNHLY